MLEFLKRFAPDVDAAAGDESSEASDEKEKPKKAKKEPEIPDVVRNITAEDALGLADQEDAFLLATFKGEALMF